MAYQTTAKSYTTYSLRSEKMIEHSCDSEGHEGVKLKLRFAWNVGSGIGLGMMGFHALGRRDLVKFGLMRNCNKDLHDPLFSQFFIFRPTRAMRIVFYLEPQNTQEVLLTIIHGAVEPSDSSVSEI